MATRTGARTGMSGELARHRVRPWPHPPNTPFATHPRSGNLLLRPNGVLTYLDFGLLVRVTAAHRQAMMVRGAGGGDRRLA